MKNSRLLVAAGVAAAIALVSSPKAQTQQQLVWETSFNCPDWVQTQGITDDKVCVVGDRIAGWGNWSTALGSYDQITAAANNPLGTGPKGFRHYRGNGQNSNGGGIKVDLPTKVKEVWVRWYMRYQAGFQWSSMNYTKDLYFNVSGAFPIFTMGFHGTDGFGIAQVNPGSQNLVGSPGWQSTMGGPSADGRWHFYEVHLKVDTNGANGVGESWVDGQLSRRDTNLNLGAGGVEFFVVGSNQCCVANTVDMYTDYDDIAISTTGYIGPIGGSASGGPTVPTNLRISS